MKHIYINDELSEAFKMFHDTQANILGGFVKDSLKICNYVIASQGLQIQFIDFFFLFYKLLKEVFSYLNEIYCMQLHIDA